MINNVVLGAIETLIETNAALDRKLAIARATRGLTYDRTTGRYRRGKRLLTDHQLTSRRDALADGYANRFARLVERYAAGDLARDGFEVSFAAILGEAALVGYAFGRGGLDQMTDADWTALGLINADQEVYARGFLADIQQHRAESLQEIALPRWEITDGLLARARQYADIVIAAYERARSAVFGLPLPEHPPVHPHCRCGWRHDVEDGQRVAYWRTDSEPCSTCKGLADRYNPWRGA